MALVDSENVDLVYKHRTALSTLIWDLDFVEKYLCNNWAK